VKGVEEDDLVDANISVEGQSGFYGTLFRCYLGTMLRETKLCAGFKKNWHIHELVLE
jgi:hypothetical protein